MIPQILTYSGNHFNFENPRFEDIAIESIAHALSNMCRFSGHTKEFYSVAQHSYLASLTIDPVFALEALLHDAAEAYLGDVSTPLKKMLPEYLRIEKEVEKIIRLKFGVPIDMSPEVKEVDLRLLATEKRDLMPETDVEWEILNQVKPLKYVIVPYNPMLSKDLFLERFHTLFSS